MQTALEVMLALARRYSFGEVHALLGTQRAAPAGAAAEVRALCEFGQQLMDLDAEDFGGPSLVPRELSARARSCRMPQTPREQPRGALASLHPVYRLLLEVAAARWNRREMAALVATVHIVSEYLPLLAWEATLGHAGDPARLRESLAGDGSLFGDPQARDCPHTRSAKAATSRALRVVNEPVAGWRAYLNRQHSNVAAALAVCAAECRQPCMVITQYDSATRLSLAARCHLAQAFSDSALIRLRHAAPVGHGFGVPSPSEVTEAWQRTRQALGEHHELASSVLAADDFPLPGLPALVSAVAGVTLGPDDLLAETSATLVTAISTEAGIASAAG